jgi:hypothetical protein
MRTFAITILLVGGLFCGPVRAGTIYNNLGPGNTWIVNREWDSNFDFMASPFVATGGGKLDTIVAPFFSLRSSVTFGLYTDSDGHPGTLLESWNVPVPGFPGVLTTLTSVLNPSLSSGTEYWFLIDNPGPPNPVAWYENNQGIPGGIWAGDKLSDPLDFDPASPLPAIQLNSIAEPASGILLGIGLLILASCRTRVLARIL